MEWKERSNLFQFLFRWRLLLQWTEINGAKKKRASTFWMSLIVWHRKVFLFFIFFFVFVCKLLRIKRRKKKGNFCVKMPTQLRRKDNLIPNNIIILLFQTAYYVFLFITLAYSMANTEKQFTHSNACCCIHVHCILSISFLKIWFVYLFYWKHLCYFIFIKCAHKKYRCKVWIVHSTNLYIWQVASKCFRKYEVWTVYILYIILCSLSHARNDREKNWLQ